MATDPKKIIAELAEKARAKNRDDLQKTHEAGQLMLWQEFERAAPNVFARSSLFSIKNRNEKRVSYMTGAKLEIPIGDKGTLKYGGDELRQDEETIWMQLVHISKQTCSNKFTIVPYAFLKSIGWGTSGRDYKRLTECLSRLGSAYIEIYEARTGRTQLTRLLAMYGFFDTMTKDVEIRLYDGEDDLMFLFAKNMYSKINWEMRLALPAGLATWLHLYFSSHREPFELTVKYICGLTGLKLFDPEDVKLGDAERRRVVSKRLTEAKRRLGHSLEKLVAVGFLKSFHFDAYSITVERACGTSQPPLLGN